MIKTEHLEYSYTSNQTPIRFALDDINLEIKEGEFVAVLGHNGCGKSTLAKHFNGLFLPTGGNVYVMGMDTKDESLYWEVRRNVGMVFQNPDNQLVATVVEEDVAFAPENLGVPSEEIRKRVDEALHTVGMYEYRRHAPHRLSGGQKQRIAIAGALAMRPKCIVLDEPTAMLDPKGRREVLESIQRLKEEEKMTVVLITHYMDEAAQADRVIVMDEGSVLLDDVPKKVFSEVKLLKKIGLDVPQVTELLYELKKAGLPVRHDILTVEECAEELAKVLANK
ncbi:MAG: energy-coupling factor transporter ATPase [Clostridia bacterium]|nr:energy-coupling factor transporter ATPase [Clostridia bacterium]MBQ3554494.1 energy-coupling factor transporter ATPase [Clostridia bacterium]